MGRPVPLYDKQYSAPPRPATAVGPAGSRLFAVRLRQWSLILLAVLVLLVGRLLQVQVVRHAHYQRAARRSHVREVPLPAARGAILDRGGNALAISIPCKSVFVDSLEYARALEESARGRTRLTPAQGEERLAKLLDLDRAWVHAQLRRQGRHIVLKKHVPERTAEQIAALRLPWVGFDKEQKRTYPYGALAAQTLGFTGSDGDGLAGIEAARDRALRGKPGSSVIELDGRGRKIPTLDEIRSPSVPGKNVRLTIDCDLQQAVEIALADGVKNAKAAGGAALVMNPGNGEVLALASQPAFDPNDFGKAPARRWVNPVVVNAYEPGSTFKLVVACAALETAMPESSRRLYCTGAKQIGRRRIHCSHGGHGQMDLERMIEQSCNIGAATIGMRLGSDSVAHTIDALGFGRRTGIELASESAGQVPRGAWSDIRLANVSFGQGISVTPLQLLRAYCAIANGGRLVRPHLLLETPGQSGAAPRVISETTAATMRRLFVQVVETGTGKTAAVQDYLVAGKTGTAQKAVPGRGYASGKYIGSFVGFLPAEKPRVAILVLIDEPANGYYGGTVAAPVFREIARQAMLRLKVPGSAPELVARYASGSAH